MADYTLLDLVPQFASSEHGAGWGDVLWGAKPLFNPNGAVTLTHVGMSALVVLVIVVAGSIARKRYATREGELVPEDHLSVRNAFEVIFDAVYNMMEGMMGRKHARQYFPLIAGLSIYILISNLMGLIPGLAPPTQNLNTNLACSMVVFVFYNYMGLRENGLNYLKHFLGPMMAIAPMILIIELFSHAFRPVSLSMRLSGNMTGDHAVLGVFSQMAEGLVGMPLLLPVPFLFLGLLVSFIQTIVFCMLSSVYIAMAVEHHEEH